MAMNDNIGINNPQEAHLACVFLLDVSGSMGGDPINNLNAAIRKFKNDVLMDELAQSRIDVAIVTFESSIRVIQDFVPISRMEPIVLQASGSTKMADGINVAIDLVKDRNRFYKKLGTPCYKPWIFMITDGYPDYDQNMEAVAERIRIEESKGSHGKLKFWACGVGQYDKTTMFKLTKRVIELKDYDFQGIFNWASESMVAISVSDVENEARPVDLPRTARKADLDREIGEDWD